MRIHNKKSSMSTKEIMIFMFVVIALLVFTVLLYQIFRSTPNTDNVCRDSAETMSSMIRRSSTKTIINNIRLNCPLQRIVIDSDNQDQALRKIAEAMRSTWYVFGEGKFNLFFSSSEQKFCLFHDLINFTGKGKSLKITTYDLIRYLNTHKMKNSNEKYCDYLYGGCLTDDQLGKLKGYSTLLNTDHTYGTLFNYTKFDETKYGSITRTATSVAVVAGAVLIGVFSGGTATPLSILILGTLSSGGTVVAVMSHNSIDTTKSKWYATISLIDLSKSKNSFKNCNPAQNYDTIR